MRLAILTLQRRVQGHSVGVSVHVHSPYFLGTILQAWQIIIRMSESPDQD